MTFRPKPDHVTPKTSADIVGFRKQIKCPLIIQFAATLWIVYGMLLLLDGALAMLIVGLSLLPIIRFLMAAVFIGIAIVALRGDSRGLRGHAWGSIVLGWAQALFTLIFLRPSEAERLPLLGYTPLLIPLALIVAGVLALIGNNRYLNWRKKRGFCP